MDLLLDVTRLFEFELKKIVGFGERDVDVGIRERAIVELKVMSGESGVKNFLREQGYYMDI